jgi:hypothetical protein
VTPGPRRIAIFIPVRGDVELISLGFGAVVGTRLLANACLPATPKSRTKSEFDSLRAHHFYLNPVP